MNDRSIILDKINRKTKEIQALEEKLKTARVYVATLTEVLADLQCEPVHRPSGASETTALRARSAAGLAREAILAAGRPMHIDELMQALGRDSNRRSRATLASALSAYVRSGEVFTRPSPNTFGIVGLNHAAPSVSTPRPMPSPTFGKGDTQFDA